MKTLRMLLCLLAMLALPFGLSACNTFEGAGEDIEESGESIEETADDWED